MTSQEFKAWFDGFSEGIDSAPTENQFEKIKAKVVEINNIPIVPQINGAAYISSSAHLQNLNVGGPQVSQPGLSEDHWTNTLINMGKSDFKSSQ